MTHSEDSASCECFSSCTRILCLGLSLFPSPPVMNEVFGTSKMADNSVFKLHSTISILRPGLTPSVTGWISESSL